METSQKPLLAIVGSTGEQGKSVLAHAYKTGKYRIRALTRNTKSETAKKLAAEYPGIELVAADYDDAKSLLSAFKGAEYAFLLTSYWEADKKQDPESDLKQGKALADAAKEAGVKFVLWSSLHDAKTITKGEIELPHYSYKNQVERYLKSIGLGYTALYAGLFASNWQRYGSGPRREKDGSLTLALLDRADVGMPILDTEADFGKFALLALQNPEKFAGQKILAAAEYQTTPQLAADYTRVTGEKVKIVPVSPDTLPLKALQETHRWFNEYGYYNGELIDNDALFGEDKPKLNNFEGWLRRTGYKVPPYKEQ